MTITKLLPTKWQATFGNISVNDETNMYTDVSSSTYSFVELTGLSVSGVKDFYLGGFEKNKIPAGSEVTGYTVRIKIANSRGKVSTAGISLYGGARGSITDGAIIPGTTLTNVKPGTLTLPTDGVDWDVINSLVQSGNLYIHIPIQTLSSDSGGGIRVYGAEIEVTYEPPKKYVTGRRLQHFWDNAKNYIDTEIPTNVSDLANDAGYLTQHQSLSDYALKSEIPTVPTNVSAFTNDSGYINDLSPYIYYSQNSNTVYINSATETGADDVITINDRVTAIENDCYNSYATDTASGAIASFPDGADGVPVKSLTVAVEPVQDLHGYDSPWPAGGGVNKFDIDNITSVGGAYGLTTSIDGDVVRISGTYTGSGSSSYRFIYHNQPIIEDAKFAVFRLDTSSTRMSLRYASTTDNAIVMELRDVTQNTSVDVKFRFVMYTGATAPTTYAPYSNICPISGRTGVTVTRVGGNLCRSNQTTDVTAYGITSYAVVNDSECRFSGTATATIGFTTLVTSAVNGATYTVTVQGATTNAVVNIKAYNGSTFVRIIKVFTADGSFTFTADGTFNVVDARPTFQSGATANNTIIKIGITGGSSSADFVAYDPVRITIPFGQTVYGGTLDVTEGKLTVTKGFIQSYNGEMLPGAWISDRDAYTEGATPTTGAEVCYDLSAPVTYNLTPTEVKSLLGQNNIFADTGDTSCEYRADTKMYIERLTAPDADMIADSNIVSGQYFMVGNSLYKATANIASGGQVIVGTNATRKSLAQALNEINV